jgi:hypothetical protein
MTWDEIRAAYPPDTWLVLEVTNERWDRNWAEYDPVRVLEVVPDNANPSERANHHLRTLPSDRVLLISTAEERLGTETVLMGLRIRDVEDEPDMGPTTVRVVDLRAQRGERHARPGGYRHGGSDHDPR